MPRLFLPKHRLLSRTCLEASNYTRTIANANANVNAHLGMQGVYTPIRNLSKRSGYTMPTALQLFKTFPAGVGRLVDSIFGYWNINESARTSRNTWSQIGGVGYIPRRQREQQRQLMRDLQKVALPVAFGALPVIGNSIFILLAWKPNLFLSSHFLAGHQRSIAHDEYRDRFGSFQVCAGNFWISVRKKNSRNHCDINTKECDEAGAIVDALALYEKCGKFPYSTIPRHQLVQIAKAAGMSPTIAWALPSVWIRYRLNQIAKDIILDDADLIRDKLHEDGCQSLTDDEILNACSLRGLPCKLDVTQEVMRECLTNHLRMVEPLFQKVGKANLIGNSKGTTFFVHLPAIRFQLKRSQASSS